MINENEKISLPTNIKQIGSIKDTFRIYMEDYVNTYISQFAKDGGSEERIAILFGENYIIDGKMVLFISGVIQAKDCEHINGMQRLTEQSWKQIEEDKEKYFNQLKCLGWVYIQPGFGEYINDFHCNYHSTYFKEDSQVLFICDPIENITSFYRFDTGKKKMKAIGGYIVYYDKNKSMQDYMIENRIVKVNIEDEKPDGFRSTKLKRDFGSASESSTPKIIDKPRTNMARVKLIAEQKKMVNLFGSLSFVLFLVCFIMGAGLMQNEGRISKIEKQLSSMDSSYQMILNEITKDNTQSVFAQEKTETTTEITTLTINNDTTNVISKNALKNQVSKQLKSEPKYREYTIKEGDNLGLISRVIYGDDSRIDEIMSINDINNPDKICAGDVIKLPLE